MQGLLQWNRRGISEVRPFAMAWLDHHWQSKTVSQYSGPASRVFHAGNIPITTYAGHYGLSFPCYEMAIQFQEPRARKACLEIARIILHRSSRNRLGLVNHDDNADFAIPDTCYFVVAPLMIASNFDREKGRVYQEQALYQLRTYIDTFLVKETGLVRTILLKDGLGKTCWTRASGWLLWAIISVLRHLPPDAPEKTGFIQDLKYIASGLQRIQDSSGGFHVLLDEPSTPLETTGTVMVATSLHESIQKGWLPDSLNGMVSRAWQFAKNRITNDGRILQAYTGWAVPAENRIMSMDEHTMEWIPGFILDAADRLSCWTT
jgi:rhamnogalacturonyl hydrolase YesR